MHIQLHKCICISISTHFAPPAVEAARPLQSSLWSSVNLLERQGGLASSLRNPRNPQNPSQSFRLRAGCPRSGNHPKTTNQQPRIAA